MINKEKNNKSQKQQVQLVVNITKNIIRQYIARLGDAIRNTDDESDKKMMKDFSMKLDGLLFYFDRKFEKRLAEFEEKKSYVTDVTEVDVATNFARDIFKKVGLPKDCIYPLLSFCIIDDYMKCKKSQGMPLSENFRISNFDLLYHKNGFYKVNCSLGFDDNSKNQSLCLSLDAWPIHKIIKEYFNKISKEKNIMVDDYIETYRILKRVSCINFAENPIYYRFLTDQLDNEDLSYIYKESNLLSKFLNSKPEVTEVENELSTEQKADKIKEKMAKLEELTKEESELKLRFDMIQKEKAALEKEINGFKL